MKHIVIIGGGVAAFECAAAARKEDSDADITVYSKEKLFPYRRPALSALAADDMDVSETFFIKKESFYADNNISIHTGKVVERIIPDSHLIEFADASKVGYDKLIIATGAAARRIPVPGADGKNTFVLRDYQDLLDLRKAITIKNMKCVIIGGGVLGLELADSLLKRDCKVTVIEGAERLMPRNLDIQGSNFVQRQMSKIAGMEMLFGKSIRKITPESVVLADSVVECDFVFFSVGTVPVFPECPGLGVERGIVVDKNMKTNLPDIFAAGDCTQFNGSGCGLYTAAAAMGKVAGICAAGSDAEYQTSVYPIRFNSLGTKIFSVGITDDSLESSCEESDCRYKKIFYHPDGKIAGVVLVGDISEANMLLKQMNS